MEVSQMTSRNERLKYFQQQNVKNTRVVTACSVGNPVLLNSTDILNNPLLNTGSPVVGMVENLQIKIGIKNRNC
jgi:flagellar hook assembly protein FlgD